MSSMEAISGRNVALTVVAPLAWGSTYVVTAALLPPGHPLWSAAIRALPAGLVLLLVVRRLPRGDQWWQAAVLGLANIGLFFPLLFLGAYRLPGGLAATVQATSPLVVTVLALLLLGERPVPARVGGALLGLLGVGLLVLEAPGGVDPIGLIGSVGSVAASALGFVLVKRWPVAGVPMTTLISWQLVAGGLVLLPLALLVEGAPPSIDGPALLGYLWIGGAGTVVAYYAWFTGLRRLPAGAVSLVGLLNPVTGTALGVLVAGEAFGWPQAVGTGLVVGGVLGGLALSRAARPEAPTVEPAPQPTWTRTSLDAAPVSVSTTRNRCSPV